MQLDIHTLVIILAILNALQFFVFLYFFLLNRGYRGYRFSRGLSGWFLWSFLSALGYSLLFVRDFLPPSFWDMSVFLMSLLLFDADMFLYIGFASFFSVRYSRLTIVLLAFVFAALTVFTVFILHDVNLRGIVLYASTAVVFALCAELLFRHAPEQIRKPAVVLGFVFAVQSVFLLVRMVLAILAHLIPGLSNSDQPQMLLFLLIMASSYLWSFGIIIMVNQRSLIAHQDAEQNLELAFNSNPDGILVTALPDGVIRNINDGFSNLFGYGRPELIGMTTIDLDLWHDPMDRSHIYAQATRFGVCDNFESVMRKKDGSFFDAIVSGRTFSINGEHFLVSSIRDISGRKAMELSLKRSEEKFRLLVENNFDIIYTLSAEGVFLFVSPVWTRLLGHDADSVVGKSFRDYVFGPDIPVCEAFLGEVISRGEPRSGVEYRVRHANGSLIWYTSGAVPFFDESGRVSGFYGIGRDIQEQKRLRDELKVQATTDELTGLYNRRHFIHIALNEIRRALRLGRALSLALIDIDHFKSINDTYGHSAGDQALVFFARRFQESIRDIDILSRFGGDEFVLLLPETSAAQGVEILERLRTSLAAMPVVLASGSTLYLTVSAGVTLMGNDAGSQDIFDVLLNRADQALYRAKASGRDRVSL